MRRRLHALVATFFLFVAVFSPEHVLGGGDPPQAGGIVVGAAPYPPFLETRDAGLFGFEYDLLRRFEAAQGVRVSYRLIPRFSDVLRALESGQSDAAGGGLHATPERLRRYAFSVYVHSGLVAVGRAGQKPIGGARDLAGLRIGAKKGATGEALARAVAGKKNAGLVFAFPRTEDSYAALRQGQIDVLFDDYLHARHLVRRGEPVAVLSKPMTSVGMGIAFRKDPRSLAIKEKLDRFLEAFTKTKEFNLLYEKYFF